MVNGEGSTQTPVANTRQHTPITAIRAHNHTAQRGQHKHMQTKRVSQLRTTHGTTHRRRRARGERESEQGRKERGRGGGAGKQNSRQRQKNCDFLLDSMVVLLPTFPRNNNRTPASRLYQRRGGVYTQLRHSLPLPLHFKRSLTVSPP